MAGSGVGTTGYCMGGRASLLVAGRHPDRVAAAASFHGGRLAATDDPDSPFLLADRIRASSTWPPPRTTPPARPTSWSAWRRHWPRPACGTRSRHPAAHGFAVPDNPTHDPAAEERHWSALERLYASALQP